MDEQKSPDKSHAGVPGSQHRRKPASAAAQKPTETQEGVEETPEERTEAKEHADALLDEALDMTFPASDPVAFTPPPRKSRTRKRR